MRAANILVAAASAALPRARAEGAAMPYLSDVPEERDLLRQEVGVTAAGGVGAYGVGTRTVNVFDECLGLYAPECRRLIQRLTRRATNRGEDTFAGRREMDFLTIPVRADNQAEYYKIFLRTDVNEQYVEGILGDSMVFYPHDWCTDGGGCVPIGPWDCDIGKPLSVDECCNVILADYPGPDINGNALECCADAPIGAASNPIDEGRVIIHVDENNKVAHPPRNE